MMSSPHMLLQLQGVVYKGLPGVEILVLQYYLTSLLTHQNLEEWGYAHPDRNITFFIIITLLVNYLFVQNVWENTCKQESDKIPVRSSSCKQDLRISYLASRVGGPTYALISARSTKAISVVKWSKEKWGELKIYSIWSRLIIFPLLSSKSRTMLKHLNSSKERL